MLFLDQSSKSFPESFGEKQAMADHGTFLSLGSHCILVSDRKSLKTGPEKDC